MRAVAGRGGGARRRPRWRRPAPEPAAAGTPASRDVRRVLIISLPATSWADIERGNAPHLDQLFSESAIADMVTRAAGYRTSIQAGYTALGRGRTARRRSRRSRARRSSRPSPTAPRPRATSTARTPGITATTGLVHLGVDALDPGERGRAVRPADRRARRRARRGPRSPCGDRATVTEPSRSSTTRCPSTNVRRSTR